MYMCVSMGEFSTCMFAKTTYVKISKAVYYYSIWSLITLGLKPLHNP